MLSKRGTERLTGIMLGVSVFLMLAHIVAHGALGVGRVSTILILLYGLPAGLAGSALYISFRRHDPILAMFSGFCFAGHGLLIILSAVILLAGLQFPEQFALYGAQPIPLIGTASSLELTMEKIGKTAFAFLGLGFSLVGLLILVSSALPRWIGWLAIAVGSAGAVICLAGLADIFVRGTSELMVAISMLVSLVFMLILGLRLVFGETPGSARQSAPAGTLERMIVE